MDNKNDAVEISQVQAIGENVVIKQDMDKDTYDLKSGVKLYIPDSVKNNRTTANTGIIFNCGDNVPEEFNLGKRVLFHKYVGYDILDKLEDGKEQNYKILSYKEIIGYVKEGMDTNEDSLLNHGRLLQ